MSFLLSLMSLLFLDSSDIVLESVSVEDSNFLIAEISRWIELISRAIHMSRNTIPTNPIITPSFRLTCQSLLSYSTIVEKNRFESFIDKLRDECLNREIFQNGKEAQTIVENWRQEYNDYRPHSSLEYLTPVEFARRYCDNNQAEVGSIKERAGIVSL